MRRWLITVLMLPALASGVAASDGQRTDQQTFVVHVVPKIEVQHTTDGQADRLHLAANVQLLVQISRSAKSADNGFTSRSFNERACMLPSWQPLANTTITIPSLPHNVHDVSTWPTVTIAPRF